MPEDRLRHDEDEVEQLDDLIDARSEGSSHFARDIDSADIDLDIPEDIDVDEALTFPHPKRKKDPYADIELMDTPDKDDIDIDWVESQEDLLPTDYMDDYDDALTTNLDDEDVVAEDQIEEIHSVEAGDIIYDVPIVTRMPKGFHVEEVGSEEAATPPDEEKRHPGELESAMASVTDEQDISLAEKFGGEIP
ncbi:MAG TPA: hypothetical protein PLP86_08355, partial [Armatimonadota bacterium]|nr:hypothetical protein [Armatimonadota bacterium]